MYSIIATCSTIAHRNFKKCAFLVKVVNLSVMTFRRMLISYVKLDHTLYSINYSNIPFGLYTQLAMYVRVLTHFLAGHCKVVH
jgi:hypothetical protein